MYYMNQYLPRQKTVVSEKVHCVSTRILCEIFLFIYCMIVTNCVMLYMLYQKYQTELTEQNNNIKYILYKIVYFHIHAHFVV